MEAVFVDDTDSENDTANPDSEAEMLFSEEEAEEPGQSTKASTSIAASCKKREHSRRKNLLQRIRGVSTVFLWQEISCRLNTF